MVASCHWLSAEARAAKRKRRRLERRYRQTRCAKDKWEYTAAAKEAKTLINQSRSDNITQRLAEATGDSRATWRVAQEVLHCKPRPHYDDSECAQLVDAFSDFFADKLRKIRDAIGAALKSCSLQQFRDRVHDGQPLTDLQAVTAGDVAKILATMPAKSSPLDAMPASLLKQCADVFSPVTSELFTGNIPSALQVGSSSTITEETRSGPHRASQP